MNDIKSDAEWSADLQKRLIDAIGSGDSDDGTANLMAEAACLLKKLSPAPEPQPVAWGAYNVDGSLRIWFGDKESAQRWANSVDIGQGNELVPLYRSNG